MGPDVGRTDTGSLVGGRPVRAALPPHLGATARGKNPVAACVFARFGHRVLMRV